MKIISRGKEPVARLVAINKQKASPTRLDVAFTPSSASFFPVINTSPRARHLRRSQRSAMPHAFAGSHVGVAPELHTV